MDSITSIIEPNNIKRLLNTEFVARHIEYFDKTDSTNEEAKRRPHLPSGTLFISDTQTAGKGRLGRKWESPGKDGIWMSLLLKADIPPDKIPQITLIAAISVCRALGNGSKIKWPNDIVIGTRKVCGILTEMSGGTSYIILGTGINVNNAGFAPELKEKATSLFIETGKKFERSEIIAAVMNEFEPLYKKFSENGFSAVIDEYKNLCITLDKDVRLIYRGAEIVGGAIDIAENGGLIVQTQNGIITVTSGEVSVRGIYDYV